jgi:hypothetical protein
MPQTDSIANNRTTHTPGPWPLETVRTQVGICHKIGTFPSRGARKVTYACVYDDGLGSQIHPNPELLANARLIAAAPDLLDALRAFCGDHEATGFFCAGLNVAYQHAMAVIAKAEKGITS